jgi:hypothetical protein
MRTVPTDYQPGGTYAICDRCGFKVRQNSLRKEWTGLMVCAEDFDPRPPELDAPRVYPEGLPRPDARPEAPDVFVGTITGNDL